MTARLLVTGSRTWDDTRALDTALLDAWHDTTQLHGPGCQMVVVHGDCPRGADAIAKDWAVRNGLTHEPHPADWDQHGKQAGFIRNQHMVNLGADLCLAFIKDGSRGASHTASAAEKAGVPVRRFTA